MSKYTEPQPHPGMNGIKRSRAGELWQFESQLVCEPKSKVVLGVDGGATSTVCVCLAVPVPLDEDPLLLLSRCASGSSNHNSVGEASARWALEHAMANALMKAHSPRSAVQAVCLALAGVDTPSDGQHYLSWLREIFPSDVQLYVHNDSVAALASGTAGKLYGCVLIAGTGTIAFGFGENGKLARASGVGPLLGDQGSGYAIASQALAAVMRAHDGRGPPTALTSTILETLNLSTPEELIGWAYADSSWARVAALVPTIKACARDGDTVARKVLDDAVHELACSVKAVVHTLKLSGKDGNKPFPFVMVGGVFESEDGWDLCKPLINVVSEMLPGAQPIRPKVEPAIGAAMVAWTQYQASLRKEAL